MVYVHLIFLRTCLVEIIMKNNILYLSIDGNNVGKMLEKYIFLNDFCRLNHFSQKISQKIDAIVECVENNSGEILLAGGDNVLAKLHNENIDSVMEKIYQLQENDLRFAIGLGKTATDAYLALKYAKSISSEKAIYYNTGSFDVYYIGLIN